MDKMMFLDSVCKNSFNSAYFAFPPAATKRMKSAIEDKVFKALDFGAAWIVQSFKFSLVF
jgi:hypothetical protein